MAPRRDILLGLVVIVIWAANATTIKFITLEVEPFTGLALRLILASLIFLPFFRWPGKEKFWLIAQITFLMVVLHWSSLIWSIERLEASMAAILLQTQVIFAVLLGRFLFKEHFGWYTTGGIALGIAGVVVLVGLPQNPPALSGVLGMVFSMLFIALSYARMKALTDISPINYMAHMHILALLPGIALAFAFEKPLETKWQNINYAVLLPALLYQVIIVSVAHMLWQRLMARNEMSGLPNLTLLLPVLGVLFAVMLLDEQVTWTMIIGGFLTMAGVSVIMLRKHKRLES